MKTLFLCFSIVLVFSNAKAQNAPAPQSAVPPNNRLMSVPIKQHGPKMGTLSLVWKPVADRTDGYDVVNSTWYPEDSEIYYYDANANDTATYGYQDVSGVWSNSTLSYYTYDASGHQLISGQQSWVGYLQEWRNETQMVQTYDAAGDRTDVQNQSWDTVANQWMGTFNSIYTFDVNHNNTEVIYQGWDSVGWVNVGNSIYTYNDSNRQTQQLDQGWNVVTSQWYNYDRYTFTYSPNDDTVVEIYSLLDTTTGVWKPKWRDISIALPNKSNESEETIEISQGWDTTSGVYLNAWEVITIDSANNLSSDEYLVWDSSFWLPNYHMVYSFDSRGNTTKELLYSNDSGSNGWAAEDEVLETYDNNNNLTEYLSIPVYGSSGYNGYSRTIYYYKSFNSDVATATKNELNASIFPNPLVANEATLNVNYEEASKVAITIYNEQGTVVSATTRSVSAGSNTIDLPIRNMASGDYFLQIVDQNNGKRSVLKVIKE